MEIPEDLFRIDKGVGYMYAYFPEHPLANKSGKVYQHRYVAWLNNNFYLPKDCHVHHIDFDRLNNQPSNLMIISPEEHLKLHKGDLNLVESVCSNCSKIFSLDARRLNRSISGKVYCSTECFSLNTRKFEIDKEILTDLVWSMPTTKVAEILGVSDKAVDKRCKKLGISKPPRGYWAKIKYAKIGEGIGSVF